MRMISCYLIDPFAQAVTMVEHNADDYRDIYRLIQNDERPFTTVGLNAQGDVIYLDDEGLFVDGQRFFTLREALYPLAGRGLVTGTDAEGYTVAPKISLYALRQRIGWTSPDLQFVDMRSEEGMIDHPALGRVPMLRHIPVFATRKREEDKTNE